MNRARRLAIGAVGGALITLVAHPASRAVLLAPVLQSGPSRIIATSPLIPDNLRVLPLPQNQVEAGIWMQVGAELALRGEMIPDDVTSLLEVAQVAAEEEPDNAYWLQLSAVFLHLADRPAEARKAWDRGALALRWDGFQSRRLTEIVSQLAIESRRPFAWHYGWAYHRRSESASLLIVNYARTLLTEEGVSRREMLQRRLSTVANGVLMRDGSRSIAIGRNGARLVEMGGQGERGAQRLSPRVAMESRSALVANLVEAGLVQEAKSVERAYQTNEAWAALADQADPAANVRGLAARSILSATLPGCILAAGLVGGLVGLLGVLLERVPEGHRITRAPFPQLLGLAMGFVVFLGTQMPLVAITLVLCFAFLEYGAGQERPELDPALGPVFQGVVALLATVFSALVTGFLLTQTTPAREVLPVIGDPRDFLGNRWLPVGLAGICLALLMLTAPAWGLSHRTPTFHVLSVALRRFGLLCFCGGICVALVATPVALVADNSLSSDLRMLMTNEPNFYLLRP